VGKALVESRILNHDFIIGESVPERPPEILYDGGDLEIHGGESLENIRNKGKKVGFFTALGEKANLGASFIGDSYQPQRWEKLRTSSKKNRGKKRARGKQDSYARAMYLAEQNLEESLLTFGGNVDLVNSFYERSLFSLKLRTSVAKFYKNLSEEKKQMLYSRKYRREMDKDLKKIFPSSGPGSAKGPGGYEQKILDETIQELWKSYLDIE
jgi:hypothetical protein